MKIAVLGSGAMGGLYSSYLSRHNEVTVIDVDEDLRSVQIKVKWDEMGGEATYETLLSATL